MRIKEEGMGKDQDPLEPVQRPAAVELDRHEEVIVYSTFTFMLFCSSHISPHPNHQHFHK